MKKFTQELTKKMKGYFREREDNAFYRYALAYINYLETDKMRNHYSYQDSKSFIVSAYADFDKSFWAWENKDGTVTSVEHIAENWPDVTVCTFRDVNSFISEITWLDYIVEGIKDKELKRRICGESLQD